MDRDNVFILGGTKTQAQIFARWLGFHPRCIVSDLDGLRGASQPTILLVGNWRRLRDISDQMEDYGRMGATFLEVTDLRRPAISYY